MIKRLIPAALLVLVFLLPHRMQAQPATSGGPLPGPLPLLPADNWWNLDVSAVPADAAQTANFQSHYGGSIPLHPDLGGDVDGEFPAIYGMVYVTVPGTEPLVSVAFDYPDESDVGAPGRPAGYPIPSEAITQPAAPGDPHWIEGGFPGDQDQGSDQHMLIVDRDHRVLFETWQTRYVGTFPTGQWQAGSGAIFPLDSDARRPEGWTSADAAGLAILPGLVRYDDAYPSDGTDPIRHAFRFTLSDSNGYVFPASHVAGSQAGALPFGARLRLKAAFSFPSGCTECQDPGVQKIVQAMKTYGLIFADNGSNMYISGTYDSRWNNDILNPAFAAIHSSDFEVLPLGYQPTSGSGACVASDTTLCIDGAPGDNRFKVEVAYQTSQGGGLSGGGHAVALSSLGVNRGGLFWFFSADNPEMLVKVLDGCGVNGEKWIFYSAGTNVGLTVTVTDTKTGTQKIYTNADGTAALPVQDTSAMPNCP